MPSVWQSVDVILEQHASAVATYTENKPIRQAKTVLADSGFGNQISRLGRAIRSNRMVGQFYSIFAERDFPGINFVQSCS